MLSTPRRMRLAGIGAALLAVLVCAPARADTVTDWNVNAANALITNAGQSPTVSTIHLAIVHGAVYDAVNSIDGRYEPYLVKVRARRSDSQDHRGLPGAGRPAAGAGVRSRSAVRRVAGGDPARARA
jgi:hypothetical protein